MELGVISRNREPIAEVQDKEKRNEGFDFPFPYPHHHMNGQHIFLGAVLG